MVVFIDYQGFLSTSNHVIFKELAVWNYNDKLVDYFLFLPPHDIPVLPFKYSEQANWVTQYYHGLEWDSGEKPYENLELKLTQTVEDHNLIYVKGLQKQKIISKLLPDKIVLNLEEVGCPNFEHLQKIFNIEECENHIRKGSACAQRNVELLVNWFDEHRTTETMSSRNESDEETETTCICFCK